MERQTATNTSQQDGQSATTDAARPRPASAPAHPLINLRDGIGNRATANFFQAKLKVGQPSDPLEQEADRVAEQVLRPATPADPPLSPSASTVEPARVQRMCSECEEEIHRQPMDEENDEELLQTKETAEQVTGSPRAAESRLSEIKGGGEPLHQSVREYFEPRFGHDFGQVRIHTGAAAAESAKGLNALAFTMGKDIAFSEGRYAPDTEAGKRLLAHELTHVVQQGRSQSIPNGVIQRQAEGNQPVSGEAENEGRAAGGAHPVLIVEDDARQVESGQMRRSEFLARLKEDVCRESDDAMRGTGQTTEGCPYVKRWFDYYTDKPASHIERALRRYAPEAASATSAGDYIRAASARVRRSVEVWATTGEITGVPDELASVVMGGAILGAIGGVIGGIASAIGGVVSGIGRAITGLGRLLFKGREGGARQGAEAGQVSESLNGGESLEGGVRQRMEGAFGRDFSGVRVHRDGRAGEVAEGMNARALTVGQEVVFGSGEYRPGTMVGDALIAHELAHVVQQSGGGMQGAVMQKGEGDSSQLEEDADVSAAHAVTSIWGKQYPQLMKIASNAMPRLRSGLRLQRCPKQQLPTSQNPFAVKEAELFQSAEKCKTVISSAPQEYDPDFEPIVIISPEQELYEYDFTYPEMRLDEACMGSIEATGCLVLKMPKEAMKSLTPVGPCFKTQSRDGVQFNSPLEVGLKTFPILFSLYVPVERLGDKEKKSGKTDETMNHELHHLVIAFELMQEFKGRLARRIQTRLIELRRQAAQNPASRENLLSQKSIQEMMKQEAAPFYDWFIIEYTRRQKPVDEVTHLPQVTIPSSWKDFHMPAFKPGDTGSFTK